VLAKVNIKLRILNNAGNFVAGWETVRFSRPLPSAVSKLGNMNDKANARNKTCS
jgi:hypothetical protein